jgi:phage tail protein X
MDSFYISKQGEMLDWIAWRHYGFSSGAKEAILADLRNSKLSALPIVLPIGTRVVLPSLTGEKSMKVTKIW